MSVREPTTAPKGRRRPALRWCVGLLAVLTAAALALAALENVRDSADRLH
jgi:hypothetical protein